MERRGFARGERRPPPPFSKLDVNGDGKLTLDEFKTHQIPRGDHETVFKGFDVSGDGVVTEEEYKNHRPQAPQRR
jgi:hypothetical protein